MNTYNIQTLEANVKIGPYKQKPKKKSVKKPTPEPRPATTSDINVNETPAPTYYEKPKPIKAFEHDKQTMIKKKNGTIKCTPKKILLAISLSLVGVIVLIGLIFLIIYLAILGTQSKDAFCMSDYSCLTNSSLYCSNAKCSCNSNATWNSTKSICVNTTNATLSYLQYPVLSVIKMFNGSAYYVTSISAYAGTAFNSPYDVAYSPVTDYYYIPDWGNSVVVALDNTFTFVKKAYLQDPWYIETHNTSVYVTTYTNFRIYKLDLYFNWVTTYLSTAYPSISFWDISYSIHSNRLYACDNTNGWLNTFDMNFNRISSESFYVGSVISIESESNNTLYIGRPASNVYVYINKAYATAYTVCTPSGSMRDLLIDTTTGTNYMFSACIGDKLIFLNTVYLSSLTYLNLSVSTAGHPYGITIDRYGRLLVATPGLGRVDVYTLV